MYGTKRRNRIRALAFAAALLLSVAVCAGAEVPAFEEKVPEAYFTEVLQDGGTVERITYPSSDYAGRGKSINKPALVYLPPDYSEGTPCDVLILLHGMGGTETEWGFTKNRNKGKNLTDHLFADGSVKNLIIVMPNGRSAWNYDEPSSDGSRAFRFFGQELRNDLIPYIDAHYNTNAAREHRAVAGLSIGAMQTVNIGLCECLDLVSAFGVFSAPKTTLKSAAVAAKMQEFPEDCFVRCVYSICGTSDGAFREARAVVNPIPEDGRLTEDNCFWQECRGGHNFNVWYLGLYNFLKLLGSLQE